jgi:hypothetical protein
MSQERQSTQGLGGPSGDQQTGDNDTLFEMLINYDPYTDDVGPILDLLFGSRSRAAEVNETSIGIEWRVLKQIANFCATRADLLTLFGPLTERELAAGATGLCDFPPMSEAELDARLAQYLAEGLCRVEEGEADEHDLYIPTSLGMRHAGFIGWNAGISERHGGWLLERGGLRGRMLASVAAAVSRNLQLDRRFENFSVWSLWEMRRAARGRRRPRERGRRRYLAEVAVPRRGERVGHRHYPAALICPKPGVDASITLIEIFDGVFDDEEMEIICRGWTVRRDVHRVNCYVTEEVLPRIWEILRRLSGSDRVAIYKLPPTPRATALVGLQQEQPPMALTPRSELRPDDEATQQQILECIGEAGSASVSALAEYLNLDEAYVQVLVEIAEQSGLISRSNHVCDGAHLFWLTKEGVDRVNLTLPAQPSSFRQARFDNDCLRIAARVRRRFPRHDVMNARQLRLVGESMLTIGGPELGLIPGLVARPRTPKGSLAAVMVARELGTITELEQMVSACAEDQQMSLILIYAAQAFIGQLKGLVRAHDVGGRIEVKRLPTAARAAKKKDEQTQHSAATALAPWSRPRPANKQTKKEVEAPKPRRCDQHVPQLPGLKPIGDAAWEAFEDALVRRVGPPSGNSVSVRLIINVAIWLIEHNRSVTYVNTHSRTCLVSGTAFTCWLARLHYAGLWGVLQSVIERYEPERGRLRWEHIDPARYKQHLFGRWGRSAPRVSDKAFEDVWEEVEAPREEDKRFLSQEEEN